MKQTARAFFIAAAVSLPTLVQAQDNPFVGRWHLDKGLSTAVPGEPVPTDMIADIQRADSLHMRWTVTTVDNHAQTSVDSFDLPANGELYPINADTSAAFRLSGSSLQGTFKDTSGDSDTLTCTLSADQRRMTCAGSLATRDGRVRRYVDVFDRMAK